MEQRRKLCLFLLLVIIEAVSAGEENSFHHDLETSLNAYFGEIPRNDTITAAATESDINVDDDRRKRSTIYQAQLPSYVTDKYKNAYKGQYGKASSTYEKKTADYETGSNASPVPNYSQRPARPPHQSSDDEAPAPPAHETYDEQNPSRESTYDQEYPAPEQYETNEYEETKSEYTPPAANYEDMDERGYETEYEETSTRIYDADDDNQYQAPDPDVYEEKSYPPEQFPAVPAKKEYPPKMDDAEHHEPCGKQEKYLEAQKPAYPPEKENQEDEERYPGPEGVYVEESHYEAPVEYEEKRAGQRYPSGSYAEPITGRPKQKTVIYPASAGPQGRSGLTGIGALALATSLLGDDDSGSSSRSRSRRRSRSRSSRGREQDRDTIRQLQMQGDSQGRKLDREQEGRRAAEAARDRERERRRDAEAALQRARDAATTAQQAATTAQQAAAACQADAAARLAAADARLAATRTEWSNFADCRRNALRDLQQRVTLIRTRPLPPGLTISRNFVQGLQNDLRIVHDMATTALSACVQPSN